MTILKRLKENLFLVIVALAYIIMFIINPSMGIDSVKNSGYYIKEMLMIMPVIFVLTALLDMWVPKEKIMWLLGKDAKAKGIFLAFVVGSISAGPIYAAFPIYEVFSDSQLPRSILTLALPGRYSLNNLLFLIFH